MDQETELQELSGTVENVLFSNEENGYTVLRLKDENDEQQTVVGCFPGISAGESILATGSWVTHPSYGKQFKAELIQRFVPVSAQDIFNYLAGGVVKGIGAATALQIVTEFGNRSLEVLENEPEKLAQIKGISLKKAREFSEAYRKQTAIRRLLEFVCAFGVRPVVALRLYRFYGDRALDILHTDPYIIASGHIGGSFAEADNMALELGFEENSSERIRAAAVFELVHNLSNGHCFVPQEKLIDAVCRLIHVEEDAAAEGLEEMVESGGIIREELRDVKACYLPDLYRAETYIAGRMLEMSRNRKTSLEVSDGMIREIEKKNGIHYAQAQKKAFSLALSNQVLILTGGPGVGKSSCTRGIVDLFDRVGLKTLLTAPTGRAAKRLEELSGREASTVHRLLGAKMGEDGEKVVFTKNEEEQLVCNAVILDESSMVDILLLESLLRAMPREARLILVGDADQLPPVGPGNVFRALINSGVIETVRLTEIFRQSGDSMIVRNAHRINKGEYPDFAANTGDFFRLKRLEAGSCVDTITQLCAERLPQKMSFKPEEIQVLSPTRRGELGTINLNRQLQTVINPPSKEKAEKLYGDVIFREGDRVMQIRNNYDILWHNEDYTVSGNGIYNGDIGYIRRIDPGNELLQIDFEGKIAEYTFASMNELEHSWAVTIHKSQGCEFKAVILALSGSSRMLLTRSVLYTGVTRAKNLLILVGDETVAKTMIDNARQAGRYTFLKYRMVQLAGNKNSYILQPNTGQDHKRMIE